MTTDTMLERQALAWIEDPLCSNRLLQYEDALGAA